MSKKILSLLIVGTALIFAAGTVMAGTEFQDTFKINTKEYKTHKKGLVEFSHKKHTEEYGAACGDCHHDDKGKPLTLKKGDDVKRCIECHKGIKKVKGEKLAKKEKLKKLESQYSLVTNKGSFQTKIPKTQN